LREVAILREFGGCLKKNTLYTYCWQNIDIIEEEEEYFIDQLRTHKGHSNYND
jgi:hypothetical protein